MAKGKHAALSAQRRYETALEHIDRLTSELVDAKARAKAAEERAARLEGCEKLVARSTARNDRLLQEALDKLGWWKKVAEEDRARRGDAMGELFNVVLRDVGALMADGLVEDKRQFLETRYPLIMSALSAGESAKRSPSEPTLWRRNPLHAAERKLSDEDLKRLQRLSGQRAIYASAPGRDAADVWVDLLDAHQAGFDADDVLTYVSGDSK